MSAVADENFIVENWKYLLAALALHAVVGVALTVTINSTRSTVIPSQLAIKAVVIDNTAKRLKREKEQADQAEADRLAREQAEADRKAREQLEAEKQREQEAQIGAKRQEEQRQKVAADQKRKADEKQKADDKRKADDKAAAVKRQTDEKRRADEIRAKQAEKLNSEREAREQAQRESELKRQLADEEGRAQAENSGLLSQYMALIQQRVERNWNQPASAKSGMQCDVRVTQAPGGTVLSVQVDKCNGDAAVRQSLEAAVYRSSPLPPPPDARLFQRVLVLVFKPKE